jgi:hypothetical protein
MTGRVYTALGIAAGAAAIVFLTVLPAPHRPATAVSAAATRAGPATLRTVWPRAVGFTIPAGFADGSVYTPRVIIDPATSIGELARPDGIRTDLVVAAAGGPPRVLQAQTVTGGGSYDGITVTAARIYWMRTLSDANGDPHTALWSAARAGGPATQLTAATGAPTFSNSADDLHAVGDRLYWTSGHPGHPDQTEIRSIPLAGGAVTVRVLAGAWQPTAWPWLVTTPGAPGPSRLHNLASGAERTIITPPGMLASCSPTWCSLSSDNAAPRPAQLIRPDGTDRRTIGATNAVDIDIDVAPLGRFELLDTVTVESAQIVLSALTLYDIHTRKTVVIDPATTNAASRGNYVWWSTGDNETLTWHGLDLRTLT